MVYTSVQEAIQDFDDACSDVLAANYRTFEHCLNRWFEVVDSEPLNTTIRSIQSLCDYDTWKDHAFPERKSQGALNLPRGRSEQLCVLLGLFRSFDSGDIGYDDFYLRYGGNSTRYDDMIYEITSQYFAPMSRDLRKLLIRSATTPEPAPAPASDRIVTIDHNSPHYQEAVTSLERTIETISGSNIISGDEKEAVLAELSAGRRLLDFTKSTWAACKTLLIDGLKYVLRKFGEGAVAIAVTAALGFLGKLFGIL